MSVTNEPQNMNSKWRFVILGCGSSGGVPRIGNDWGACDPDNERNRRRRSSFLVEKWQGQNCTRLLIDTSPDLREQLLTENVSVIDGVAFSHDHADHIHGIDDLRVVYLNRKKRIPCLFTTETGKILKQRFKYCFETPKNSGYVPILEPQPIEMGQSFSLQGKGGNLTGQSFRQVHGSIESLGFRFGKLAYATDVSAFPQNSEDYLYDLDVLILGALRYTPHPCHFSVDQALEVIDKFKPKRTILTHLHVDLDYQTLKDQLPDSVEPAHDGMDIILKQ